MAVNHSVSRLGRFKSDRETGRRCALAAKVVVAEMWRGVPGLRLASTAIEALPRVSLPRRRSLQETVFPRGGSLGTRVIASTSARY